MAYDNITYNEACLKRKWNLTSTTFSYASVIATEIVDALNKQLLYLHLNETVAVKKKQRNTTISVF